MKKTLQEMDWKRRTKKRMTVWVLVVVVKDPTVLLVDLHWVSHWNVKKRIAVYRIHVVNINKMNVQPGDLVYYCGHLFYGTRGTSWPTV